jgi:ferredoxin
MDNAYATNTLVLDLEKCNGCGMCAEVCPHAVFLIRARKAMLSNSSRCMECGACALNCPVDALHVESGVGCATAMIIAALRGMPMEAARCGGETPSTGDASCCG